jgi:hypothetical protein
VFGKRDSAPVDTADLAGKGFHLKFAGGSESIAVAGGGDVNGDGFGDLAAGTGRDPRGRRNAGTVAVVYGRARPGDIDLARPLGRRGYLIIGAHGGDSGDNPAEYDQLTLRGNAGDALGGQAAIVGDTNRDGLADIAIGARGVDAQGRDSGGVYVVYGRKHGKRTDLRGGLKRRGFLVAGEFPEQNLGHYQGGGCCIGKLAPTGDVNGDGRADIGLVSEDLSDEVRGGTSRAYLAFAPRRPGTVRLAGHGSGAVRFRGAYRRHERIYPPYFAIGGGGNAFRAGRAAVIVAANLKHRFGSFIFECPPARRCTARR